MAKLQAVPQIVMDGDAARTRKSDPRTSHHAADVAQRSLKLAKLGVLHVIRDNPNIVGSEVNDLYRFASARHDWMPNLAWDSPRKRAGELAADGYLDVVGERVSAGNHLPESVYVLSEKAERVLSLGKKVAA